MGVGGGGGGRAGLQPLATTSPDHDSTGQIIL